MTTEKRVRKKKRKATFKSNPSMINSPILRRKSSLWRRVWALVAMQDLKCQRRRKCQEHRSRWEAIEVASKVTNRAWTRTWKETRACLVKLELHYKVRMAIQTLKTLAATTVVVLEWTSTKAQRKWRQICMIMPTWTHSTPPTLLKMFPNMIQISSEFRIHLINKISNFI